MLPDRDYMIFIDIFRDGDWLIPKSPLDPMQALWAMEKAEEGRPLKEGDCVCQRGDNEYIWIYVRLLHSKPGRIYLNPSEHDLMTLDPRGLYRPLPWHQKLRRRAKKLRSLLLRIRPADLIAHVRRP